jgi:hypothetical protein
MLFINKDSFSYSFPILICVSCFSYLVILARTSNTQLNNMLVIETNILILRKISALDMMLFE